MEGYFEEENEENVPPEIRPISPLHLLEVQPKRRRKAESNVFVWKDDLVYYLINQWQQEDICHVCRFPLYVWTNLIQKLMECLTVHSHKSSIIISVGYQSLITKKAIVRTVVSSVSDPAFNPELSFSPFFWFCFGQRTPEQSLTLISTHSLLPPSCPNSTKKIRS